ncbi:hypothetical protein ACFOWE_12375 [Planomonospora corallina]|uniref:Uncharacterized protein n=1 Tax=Planomonospora corallina TaxID=1806052 RepID=A0ABV8I9G8_9ACTN
MAGSPKSGGNLVVAAWSEGNRAYFDWHRTDRAFDTFIVLQTSAAGGDQVDFRGGFRGRAYTVMRTNGGYRWNVKGRDSGVSASSCQRTWTVSVTG